MTRVLVVEDDPGISEPLARALRRAGYVVDVRADGHEALDGVRANPDLVILDIGLPGLDGLEVCRRLRETGDTVPVLFLSARADEVDLVVGLDAGGDDYVVKPFRLAELLARVRAILRRRSKGARPAVESGIRIDPESRRLWFRGSWVRLTQKEFDIMRVLIREQGRVVTRDQLTREVWGTEWYLSTKALDMHISTMRRKLGDDPARPRYLSTVRGLGFRFELPVDSGAETDDTTELGKTAEPGTTAQPAGDLGGGTSSLIVE
ncbi:MAG: DNA-binding response regulator [Actinomycetales bacterium]|nr:MAG: DNA-binding response regulator [Actinomycetales bacterium]